MHQFGPLIRFTADKEFASTIHMLEALPFAPPNDVFDLFDTLADCIKIITSRIKTTDKELPRASNAIEG